MIRPGNQSFEASGGTGIRDRMIRLRLRKLQAWQDFQAPERPSGGVEGAPG